MKWIDIVQPGVLEARAEPRLIVGSRVKELRDFFQIEGGSVVEVDLATAESDVDVIGALKAVLPFPDWCGSSWDSVDDALAELTEEWNFPLLVLVSGLPELLASRTHVALNSVLGLSSLSRSFSLSENQLEVVYSSKRWAG